MTAPTLQRLALRKKLHKLLDPPLPRLLPPRRLDAPQERVALRLAQALEERTGLLVAVQGGLEVGRDRDRARRRVRPLPPPVRLGRVDRGLPGGAHAPGRGQRGGPVGVAPRPDAVPPPRRELLEEVARVVPPPLPVDPPEAQRRVERLLVRDRRGGGAAALLADLQPDARRARVVGLQPRLPRPSVREEPDRQRAGARRRPGCPLCCCCCCCLRGLCRKSGAG